MYTQKFLQIGGTITTLCIDHAFISQVFILKNFKYAIIARIV